MMLFRGWRYTLKEEHFAGKTVTEATPEAHRDEWNWLVNHWADPKQQHISEKNRSNRLSQKIKPSNGAKSTARIYHDEIMPLYNLAKDSTQGPTREQTTKIPQRPPYVQLWEKTKKHKDVKWDPEGEVKYEEFKKLHEDQIQKHGVDNLSLKEAYVEVLKAKPGYHRGP
ncbi:hypothetical protein Cgig2_015284 [Carnegiea gigantea]|uniref:Uncharacterized protein n=1 Tax=Carnegiea gigantea TaxID=171969 RepID=A0A9Q1QDP1_9CARY|nr:hypothetical protein Cgig2_015284 [Carnegiea gigantea]